MNMSVEFEIDDYLFLIILLELTKYLGTDLNKF